MHPDSTVRGRAARGRESGGEPPRSKEAGTHPLLLRMRGDLEVRRSTLPGRSQVVVKDPLGLKYYRFEAEEFAILEMLDGQTSLEQIQERFAQQFPPQTISLPELQRLLGRLYGDGLLVSDAPGQGEQRWRRCRESARQRRHELLTNLLCLRFRGVDPDRFLTWLNRWCGWLFSPLFLMLGLLGMASAVLLVAVEFRTLESRLPAFHEFFATKNWLWLAATLAVTKILHELGHGLACKRLGGECHELGVMLLVLTPCLYCNVSDAWVLPNKWHRAAIAAAGVYVELLLAALCAWLWWWTQPGLLHYLCLNVLFISSVSTLLFNANPLLRYDGYYVLADLLEIPNLRQKATEAWRRVLRRRCLGLPAPPERPVPRRHRILFAVYAVAAVAYRWVMVLSIVWFLDRVLTPYRLRILGQLLAVAACYGLLLHPLWQGFRFLAVPGTWDHVRRRRLVFLGGGTAGILLAVWLLPWPHHVICRLHLQPGQAAAVYVEVPGRVTQVHVRPGQYVAAGQPLLTLENFDTRLVVERLRSERNQLAAKLNGLRQRSLRGDSVAGQEIEPTQQALAAVAERLQQREHDLERLVIAAPRAGVVLAPSAGPSPTADATHLPTWSGQPLEPRNVGAYLAAGVLVCQVADLDQWEAVLAVDQSQVAFLRPGQPVRLCLDSSPSRAIQSRIEQIAVCAHPADSRGPAAARRERENPPTDRRHPPLTLTALYQASCPFEDTSDQSLSGVQGRARVFTGYQTLGQRLGRWLLTTWR